MRKQGRSSPVRPFFEGTLDGLIERYILPNIPSAESVLEFHDGLVQYVERSDAVFLLRMIPGTQRREIYTTASGVRFKATDTGRSRVVGSGANAPATADADWRDHVRISLDSDHPFRSKPITHFG